MKYSTLMKGKVHSLIKRYGNARINSTVKMNATSPKNNISRVFLRREGGRICEVGSCRISYQFRGRCGEQEVSHSGNPDEQDSPDVPLFKGLDNSFGIARHSLTLAADFRASAAGPYRAAFLDPFFRTRSVNSMLRAGIINARFFSYHRGATA